LPVVTLWLVRFAEVIERAGWGLVLAPWGPWAWSWLAGGGLIGGPVRRRIACRIPVVGPMWRWAAMMEFSHLLALLLEGRCP
jgi:type II secretory pathway component PulF